MTIMSASLTAITDAELLTAVTQAATYERGATANLIALLAELDTRRLYLGEGCSSLFTYCTHVLRLSEHAAYGRIEAARCARRFPIVLDLLSEGAMTLTTIGLLTPHLTAIERLKTVLRGGGTLIAALEASACQSDTASARRRPQSVR